MVTISSDCHKAVIFDLDGVITKTAELHAQSWKILFDECLALLPRNHLAESCFRPFDQSHDYLLFVDGKPRSEGVRSFLRSRGLELPEGDPDDTEDRLTISALSKKKNRIFSQILREHGIETYPSTVSLMHRLHQAGIPLALISSSKNCESIIRRVNLYHHFVAIIDGCKTAEWKLRGKPHADVFLKAADMMKVPPKQCVVIEDAVSGVEAGSRAHFGLVIGVDRDHQRQELLEHGADCVVKDLQDVVVSPCPLEKPDALKHMQEIRQHIGKSKPLFFFDYDGTLTPIVARPELAKLGESMRQVIRDLKERYFVAILSGRDREDVEKLVGINGLLYAGNHGFDIGSGQHPLKDTIDALIGQLDEAQERLVPLSEKIEGAWIERKRYSLAVHVRQCSEEGEAEVKKTVTQISSQMSQLRMMSGKKVFELQPDLSWNKGIAMRWLSKIAEPSEDVIPVFIGDDTTDEDGFITLVHRGVSLCVQSEPRATAARYVLKDVDAVECFLRNFVSGDFQ